MPFGVAKKIKKRGYLLVKPLCVEESEIDWLTGSAVLQGVCDTDVSLHPFSFFHGQFTRKRTKRENLVEVCFQERKKIHPQSPMTLAKVTTRS